MLRVAMFVVVYVSILVASKHIHHTKNGEKTHLRTKNSITGHRNVRVDSVMLRHTVVWDRFPGENNFSVLYRSKGTLKWMQIPQSRMIDSTHCDASHEFRNALLTYYITVVSDINTQVTEKIQFRPELDTTLLPPQFSAFRHKEVIFIRPVAPVNLGTGQMLIEEMRTLKYQVHYYTPRKPILSENISVLIHDTQIASPSLDPSRQFCFRIRLFEPDYAAVHAKSGFSVWSNTTCFKGQHEPKSVKIHDRTALTGVGVSLGCVLFIFLLFYGTYRGYKVYKSLHKVGEVPKSLNAVLAEMEAMTVDRYQSWTPNTEMYDVVSLKPLRAECSYSTRRTDDQGDVFLYGFGKQQASSGMVYGENWTPPSTETMGRRKSRGYHSVSSESTDGEPQDGGYVHCGLNLPGHGSSFNRWPRQVNEYLPVNAEGGFNQTNTQRAQHTLYSGKENNQCLAPTSLMAVARDSGCYTPSVVLEKGLDSDHCQVNNPTYSSDVNRSTPDLFHTEDKL
nr:uncharacterized protein LOC100184523 [Ciona intestinalis]|eukprot:XP_002128492.2 uncharacterized protein LOC100184523 [Ciona intestinalis]